MPIKFHFSQTRHPLLAFLAATLLLATACAAPQSPGVPFPTSTSEPTRLPPPTATISPTETLAPTDTPTPILAGITVDMLRNMTYQDPLENYPDLKTFTLSNGVFHGGSGIKILDVSLLDPVALGDLNGDGIPDAAIVLAEKTGGTGTFKSLVGIIYQANGETYQTPPGFTEDRPVIKDLTIQNLQVRMEAIRHNDQDPFCCPSLTVNQTYELLHSRLTLIKETSQAPDGKTREITIDGPPEGTQVLGQVLVHGSVTVVPENKALVYRIFDVGGTKLDEGTIPVNLYGSSGAGTFNSPVSLAKLAGAQVIRLEVSDLGPTGQGVTLAMTSVELVVK